MNQWLLCPAYKEVTPLTLCLLRGLHEIGGWIRFAASTYVVVIFGQLIDFVLMVLSIEARRVLVRHTNIVACYGDRVSVNFCLSISTRRPMCPYGCMHACMYVVLYIVSSTAGSYVKGMS